MFSLPPIGNSFMHDSITNTSKILERNKFKSNNNSKLFYPVLSSIGRSRLN